MVVVNSPFLYFNVLSYLTLIGLETLPLRMKQHMKNAEIVAKFLITHPKVSNVSWAGFKENNYNPIILSRNESELKSISTEIKCDYRVCDVLNKDRIKEIAEEFKDQTNRIGSAA